MPAPTAIERWVGKDAPADRKARVFGVFVLLLGLGLTKAALVDPLREAQRHEARSLILSSSVVILPALLVLGTALLLAGKRGAGWIKNVRRANGKLTVKGWILTGIFLVPGVGLHFWLEHRLAELGYGR